jgi:hypothetical protein
VTTTTSPFFPNGTGGATYGTNVTQVGWIYPAVAVEANETGLMIERSGNLGAGNTGGLQYGGQGTDTIGAHWDGDQQNIWNAGYGYIPSFMWNMVALVASPTSLTYYVGNTNTGLSSWSYVTNNINMPWGAGFEIGNDPSYVATRNFVGYMSSFAMFSNSLTPGQLELLFAAGLSNTTAIPPIISSNAPAQFRTNYLVAGGYSASIVVTGYGGTNSGAYWQFNNSNGWAPATSIDLTTPTAAANGVQLVGTLTITNFTSANDAGSYELVVTNSVGSATSSVIVLAPYTPAANSFAAQVVSSGAVAFWPLNEASDASTGAAVAYDIIGGFNGLYGTNAQTAVSNTVNQLPAVSGPTSPAWTGFPGVNGALGDRQSVATNPFTYVTTTGTPTLPSGPGSTNATVLAWVYPNIYTESNTTAVFLTRSNYLGSLNTAGIQYYGNSLGYHWDNDSAVENTYASGLVIPSNTWSMLAVVITPSNNYFYVASTNYGLVSAIEGMTNTSSHAPTNTYEPWGGGANIGSDPGNIPAATLTG